MCGAAAPAFYVVEPVREVSLRRPARPALDLLLLLLLAAQTTATRHARAAPPRQGPVRRVASALLANALHLTVATGPARGGYRAIDPRCRPCHNDTGNTRPRSVPRSVHHPCRPLTPSSRTSRSASRSSRHYHIPHDGSITSLECMADSWAVPRSRLHPVALELSPSLQTWRELFLPPCLPPSLHSFPAPAPGRSPLLPPEHVVFRRVAQYPLARRRLLIRLLPLLLLCTPQCLPYTVVANPIYALPLSIRCDNGQKPRKYQCLKWILQAI